MLAPALGATVNPLFAISACLGRDQSQTQARPSSALDTSCAQHRQNTQEAANIRARFALEAVVSDQSRLESNLLLEERLDTMTLVQEVTQRANRTNLDQSSSSQPFCN